MNQSSHFFNIVWPSEEEPFEIAYNKFLQSFPIRQQIRNELETRELVHEKFLTSFKFDSSLPKSITPNIKAVLPDEPLLFLNIIKSKAPIKSISSSYVVTPRGVLYSLRKETEGDVTIGRQQSTETGHRPNDVMLHPNDLTISRCHCRLIYKYGLFSKREVPEEFLAFCMMGHKRLGKYSFGKKLHRSIYMCIFDFLKDKKRIILEDVGSAYGTYVRLSRCEQVQNNCDILLSDDALINIVGIYPSGFAYLLEHYGDQDIHLCRENVDQLIEEISENSQLHFRGDFEMKDDYWKILDCPLMKIYVSNSSPCTERGSGKMHTIIIADPEKAFKCSIGPYVHNDIKLIKAISACDIIYDSGKWFIQQGAPEKKLLNQASMEDPQYGVWLSISGTKYDQERYSPGSRELHNGDEFKVGGTVFLARW